MFRLGREYLQVGQYTELIFPSYGVRFIAVNDGIMEARLQELKDSSSDITRFIENAKRYSEIPELTSEILRIFIKRVEVSERTEKYSRTAPQEVRIYYRDIGLVDELPQSMAEVVAEDIPNEVA